MTRSERPDPQAGRQQGLDLLDQRLARLEARTARLGRDQIQAISDAVADLSSRGETPIRVGVLYWLVESRGARLDRPTQRLLERGFRDCQVVLAAALTGRDLRSEQAGLAGGLGGFLRRIVSDPQRDLQRRATAAIEAAGGAVAWRGLVGVWNGWCAVLLAERLEPDVAAALGEAWRRAVGPLPA
jgi:hypothetical protein